MSGTKYVSDSGSDANTHLQQLFVSLSQTPFGSSYKSMHEVGFNKRMLSPTNQPPADGHPTCMEFKVSSTLSHLLHNMYWHVRFCIKPKTAAQLGAVLNSKSDAIDGTACALTKLLENIKLHHNSLLGTINNIEMRHNSVVFQHLRCEYMQAL